MLCKHIKVEPQRFYYWCDKLGILVWQDTVSGDEDVEWGTKGSPFSNYQFELDLVNMLNAFHNHILGVAFTPQNFNPGESFIIKDVEPGMHTLYVRYYTKPFDIANVGYALEEVEVKVGESTYVEVTLPNNSN